ncbi:MAG TPA: hypothetical protein VHK68_09870, partial [Gemmatimonadales bacterium]|nr:hypothetical protein [Gemmatimonadales bacterium]
MTPVLVCLKRYHRQGGKDSGQDSFRDGLILLCLYEKKIGKVMKGIVIDSAGNIWAASGGDDHVYLFDSDGTLIGGYQGGGTYGPW